MCSFSQRLQRPYFVRKTKHSKVGEEDVGYCYIVLARGKRPITGSSLIGRTGGIGDEEAEKARVKKEGKSMLQEVEGGEYEMVSLFPPSDANDQPEAGPSQHRLETADGIALRDEAYSWPRLVAPPLKRSGHVVMDVCAATGASQARDLINGDI